VNPAPTRTAGTGAAKAWLKLDKTQQRALINPILDPIIQAHQAKEVERLATASKEFRQLLKDCRAIDSTTSWRTAQKEASFYNVSNINYYHIWTVFLK